MSDDILLKIYADVGEIKGLLKGQSTIQKDHADRIITLEANYTSVAKKQYGMLAIMGFIGSVVTGAWTKLVG